MSDQSIGSIVAYIKLDLSQLTSGVEDAKATITALGTQIQSNMAGVVGELGASIESAGSKIVDGLSGAVGVAGQYDQALRDVSAVNKLSESQFQDLHGAILEMTKDPLIVQGPTELAKGMYRIASAGFEGKEGLEVMRQAARGATAGMTDTATSSLALIAVLKSFPTGMYTARQAMDLMVGEVDLGVNTFGEFAKSVGRVLPIAAMAHIGLDEIAAATATLTRGGLSASQAMTALLQFINHVVHPSKTAAAVMDQLGIAHGAAAFQAKGLGGMIEMVSEKTHGNADAMAKAFPEIKAMTGAMVLARDKGSEYATVLEQERAKTQGLGATNQVATEQMKGFKNQSEKARQELEVMAIKIGDDLLPLVRDLVGDVRHVIDAFLKLPPETRKNIVEFAAFAGVGMKVGGMLLNVVATAARAGLALKGLGVTMAGVRTTLGALVTSPGFLLLAGGAAANAYAHAAFDVHDPAHGPTNVGGGQVDQAQRRLFLTQEIAKLEKSMKEARGVPDEQPGMVDGVRIPDSVIQRNREQLAQYKAELAALPAAVKAATKPAPKPTKPGGQWPAGGDAIPGLGDSSKNATANAKKAAKQAANDAKEIADQIQEAREAAFRNTHSDYENQIADAKKQYKERIAYDPGNQQLQKAALDEYLTTVKKIQAEQRKEQKQTVKEQLDQILETSKAASDDMHQREAEEARAAAEEKRTQLEALKAWAQDLKERAQREKEARAEKARADKEAQAVEAERLKRNAEEGKAAEMATQRLYDNRLEWQKENGEISLRDYKKILQEKLKAENQFSDEWMAIQAKIKKVTEEIDQQQPGWKKALEKMRDDAQSILVDHLATAFQHGFKGFFKSILQDFEQMLAQMAAKAVVSGIFGLLGMAGGPAGLGGLTGGILSGFGFDDGANDNTAKRWGWDFASMFTRGAQDYTSQRQPGRAARVHGGGAGDGGRHVTVNMYGEQHYHGQMDAERVASTMSWHAQNRLVVARAPKG